MVMRATDSTPQRSISNERKKSATVHNVAIAVGECFACIGEYLLVHLTLTSLKNLLEETVLKLVGHSHSNLTRAVQLALVILETAAIVAVVLIRFSAQSNFKDIENVVDGTGLNQVFLSKRSKLVVTVHVLSSLVLLAVQVFTSYNYYSFENYYEQSGSGRFDFIRVFEIIIASPAKEEVLFRGYMYHVLMKRCGSIPLAIIIANLFFGAVHLLNLSNDSYSSIYVLLQIVLGVEVGIFYSYSYILSNSLLECVLLHIMNNFLSSFMPTTKIVDLYDPFIAIPMLETALFFAYCIYTSHKEYVQKYTGILKHNNRMITKKE